MTEFSLFGWTVPLKESGGELETGIKEKLIDKMMNTSGGWLHLGENRCRCVAVSSECFVELVQCLQHRFLVLIFPQWPVSDQPSVVIQRAAETGAAYTALLHRLLGFHRETLNIITTHILTSHGLFCVLLQKGVYWCRTTKG